jgi:branched-chain amino acid transport system ATP-binding protein
MRALDIIQAEHRSMWRVTTAMDSLRTAMANKQDPQVAARTVISLIDYIDGYVDQVHHPKEDQFLFRLLRERDPLASMHLERLQQEHRDGPRYRDQLRILALEFERGQVADERLFFDALETFAEHVRAHIRLEETTVMPAARGSLQPADWEQIDAAFLNNDDPLFGVQIRSEFTELRARIVALAPEPVGLGGQQLPAIEVQPVRKSAGTGTVLEIRNISSRYGRVEALHSISLVVKQGQLVALVGANGAGKTTLLRSISGVQPVSAGSIHLFGRDITLLPSNQRVRLGICHVPEGRQVFGPMNVEDNLRLGGYTRARNNIDSDLARMYELFPILKEKRALPAGTLSGGQQQMLAIARALMGHPKLLLLDEPSMGLAPLLVEEVFRMVKHLKSEGITILLVEQNAHAALSIADFGYVMETGHTILAGTGADLLENEQVRQAYLGM